MLETFDPANQVLIGAFLIAVLLGAVVNKTGFCTMGAVSDWVNMGDTGRLRAWVFAITLALAGVTLFEARGSLDLDGATLPPYRTAEFAWLRYLLGGLLFGIGMTLASGCGNKTLVRLGAGNLKSLVVFLVIGAFAYLMTRTDFYALVFHPWISATSLSLDGPQDLGALAAAAGLGETAGLRQALGLGISALLLVWVWVGPDFRGSPDHILGGLVVGLAVLGGWMLTGTTLGQAWIEAAQWLDQRPIGVATQSYTFVNPMAEVLAWGAEPGWLLVSFGVVAVAGVVLGSLFWALVSGGFRLEWFSSTRDALSHVLGAALMGIGGVLAMGCTVGQAITGVSTLALGSWLSFAAIILGSALTMKVQYYRLVYADEAGFTQALFSALVDMRLLPRRCRRLDAP